MEKIFYAALALHMAGKPVNRENIRTVLKAAGSYDNEAALDALAAFIESQEDACRLKGEAIDPRIVEFLGSELPGRRLITDKLQFLLQVLSPISMRERNSAEDFTADSRCSPAVTGSLIDFKNDNTEESPGRPAGLPAKIGLTDGCNGRYIYGISASGQTAKLGPIGIESKEVYTIPYREICAVVHNCQPEPYISNQTGRVQDWILSHQKVVDTARLQFGTTIPLGFDVIVQAPNGALPDQVVKDWLKEDYDRLVKLLYQIRGKDEYVVQIFYNPVVLNGLFLHQNTGLKKIEKELACKSPGVAYLYRQKLDKLIKVGMGKLADEYFDKFYGKIKAHCQDIIVEKVKKAAEGKVMLLNVSCLVSEEKIEGLGRELDSINDAEGFSVHFSGPWPPYSFVGEQSINKRGLKEMPGVV